MSFLHVSRLVSTYMTFIFHNEAVLPKYADIYNDEKIQFFASVFRLRVGLDKPGFKTGPVLKTGTGNRVFCQILVENRYCIWVLSQFCQTGVCETGRSKNRVCPTLVKRFTICLTLFFSITCLYWNHCLLCHVFEALLWIKIRKIENFQSW